MKRIAIILLSIVSCVSLFAQESDDLGNRFNPVQTAVFSQSIVPDARAGGMGDVGAGTPQSVLSPSAVPESLWIIPLGSDN